MIITMTDERLADLLNEAKTEAWRAGFNLRRDQMRPLLVAIDDLAQWADGLEDAATAWLSDDDSDYGRQQYEMLVGLARGARDRHQALIAALAGDE